MRTMILSPWIVLGFVVVVAMASRTLFVVEQGNLVLVKRFEHLVSQPLTHGVHARWPFLDQIIRLDGRMRLYQSSMTPYRTADGAYVLAEATVMWRIADARRFYMTLGGVDNAMQERLAQHVGASLMDMARSSTLAGLLEQGHEGLQKQWPWVSSVEMRHGIAIEQITLSRLEPEGKSRQTLLERMREDQETRRRQVQMQGEAEALRWRERADDQAEAVLDRARRRSAVLQGEGIAQALEILEPARRQAPELEAMLQALEVTGAVARGKAPVWIATPADPFFSQLLKDRQGAR